jgi:hypothetical protein
VRRSDEELQGLAEKAYLKLLATGKCTNKAPTQWVEIDCWNDLMNTLMEDVKLDIKSTVRVCQMLKQYIPLLFDVKG